MFKVLDVLLLPLGGLYRVLLERVNYELKVVSSNPQSLTRETALVLFAVFSFLMSFFRCLTVLLTRTDRSRNSSGSRMSFCLRSDALSMHLLSSLALCCLEVEPRREKGAECVCRAILSLVTALSDSSLLLLLTMLLEQDNDEVKVVLFLPEVDSDMTLVLFWRMMLWRSIGVVLC